MAEWVIRFVTGKIGCSAANDKPARTKKKPPLRNTGAVGMKYRAASAVDE
jgi:hypothetical protein